LAVGETVRVTIRDANKVEEIFVDGQNVETTVQEEQALAEAADGGDLPGTLDSTTATPRGPVSARRVSGVGTKPMRIRNAQALARAAMKPTVNSTSTSEVN
jgi:hypothetical protein